MDAIAEEKKEGLPPIIATDISPEAVDNAHSNAIAAGVSQCITFKACDFADTPVPESDASPRGVVFFNGPIDCRLFVYPGCELKGQNVK